MIIDNTLQSLLKPLVNGSPGLVQNTTYASRYTTSDFLGGLLLLRLPASLGVAPRRLSAPWGLALPKPSAPCGLRPQTSALVVLRSQIGAMASLLDYNVSPFRVSIQW